MSDPRIENGYTRIANELLEAFAHIHLTGNHWRLIWAILRRTYGWGKRVDMISLSQFEKMTGIQSRHVSRELKILVEMNIIIKDESGYINSYGIQKKISRWKYSQNREYPKMGISEIGNETTPRTGNETTPKIGKYKRNKEKKENNSVKISAEISSLRQRYSNQDLIEKAFEAIASTRKTNSVAESILLAQLQKWGKYPVEQVVNSIQAYLDKDCADQGKKENYLLGIIRNSQDSSNSKKPQDENWLKGAI